MPLQDLVQHDAVDEPAQTDPEQDARRPHPGAVPGGRDVVDLRRQGPLPTGSWGEAGLPTLSFWTEGKSPGRAVLPSEGVVSAADADQEFERVYQDLVAAQQRFKASLGKTGVADEIKPTGPGQDPITAVPAETLR